jgi:hypothetical protein
MAFFPKIKIRRGNMIFFYFLFFHEKNLYMALDFVLLENKMEYKQSVVNC